MLGQRAGGYWRSNVMLSVSIIVVSGMGSWWHSLSWPAFRNNLLLEASSFSVVAVNVPGFWVTW